MDFACIAGSLRARWVTKRPWPPRLLIIISSVGICFIKQEPVRFEFFENFRCSLVTEVLTAHLFDFFSVLPFQEFGQQGVSALHQLSQQHRYGFKNVFADMVFDVSAGGGFFGDVEVFYKFKGVLRHHRQELCEVMPAGYGAFFVDINLEDITNQYSAGRVQKRKRLFDGRFRINILKALAEKNKVVPFFSLQLLIEALENFAFFLQ